jgi:signal transduction histidine kinase
MIKDIADRIADRVRWGYLAAFTLLLISYIISYFSAQKLMQQSMLATHTKEVLHDLDNVVSFVTGSESAVRGYIINNKSIFLSRYYISREHADSTFKRVRQLTIVNPAQQKNLDTLKELLDNKFRLIDNDISIFTKTHTISPGILEENNERIFRMLKIENFVHKIENEERKLWMTRYGEVAKYSAIIRGFNVISLIMAILLTIYSLITFTKENKAKREARKKADAYHEQLKLRIDELAALNLELIELRNMEKFAATGRISRTIAHEVRNPLTNINLAAEQLRTEIPLNDDTAILFDMISRNSNRINQLISDLLNSTRITELNHEKSSINSLIDSSLQLAEDRINLKQIKVVKDYDFTICDIMVDPEKIKIAFLNIIVNAIEAMNDEGVLHITTQTKNGKCVTIIRDNGKGMTKADVGRLFEPYFTTKEKGTGLGLTNTQNIILSHNASITVESEIEKGTAFTITFDFA